MRWEKLQMLTRVGEGGQDIGCGPGKRWGHTCNAIRGGKLLYVFGGYGRDNCQTNQVHVFDTATRTWSKPVTKGTPPVPRDSHSCTTVSDNLFVFGGTDGMNPLKDLHILDTYSNTWISPSVRGEGPEAREGHGAAVIGKRLFIFGGCRKDPNNCDEEFYDDLYILNTETFVWKRADTSGSPPAKRSSHTCSSWKNKIIVIGGEDSYGYYLSDVHILDADDLVWTKLHTSGQLLPPRGGHTTVSLGRNLFVFGGFTDESSLYDDIYMLDVDTGVWTKVMAAGEGPFARFSMAGDSLDPQKSGVLSFLGGCNKNLEALDDMYYLHTGLVSENERDERRLSKLSLRKQLKLKCQEQNTVASLVYDKALVRIEPNGYLYKPIHMPSTDPNAGRPNIYSREYQPFPGKKTFQAKVTKCLPVGYTIETVIDGKLLRGVLFSSKLSFNHSDDDSKRRKKAVEIDGFKQNDDQKTNSETARPIGNGNIDDRQVDGVRGEIVEDAAAFPNVKRPAASDASHSYEVTGSLKVSGVADGNVEENKTGNELSASTEVCEENISLAASVCVTVSANPEGTALTAEDHGSLTTEGRAQSV